MELVSFTLSPAIGSGFTSGTFSAKLSANGSTTNRERIMANWSCFCLTHLGLQRLPWKVWLQALHSIQTAGLLIVFPTIFGAKPIKNALFQQKSDHNQSTSEDFRSTISLFTPLRSPQRSSHVGDAHPRRCASSRRSLDRMSSPQWGKSVSNLVT